MRARRSGSWPRPPAGQRVVGLQGGDLGRQQLTFEQHLTQLRLQALALEPLTGGGPGGETGLSGSQESLLPCAQGRGRDAQRPRGVSRSSPRSSRSTASRLRWRDMRPPRPGPTLICSVVSVVIITLLRITSAYRVSQQTGERRTMGFVPGKPVQPRSRAEG